MASPWWRPTVAITSIRACSRGGPRFYRRCSAIKAFRSGPSRTPRQLFRCRLREKIARLTSRNWLLLEVAPPLAKRDLRRTPCLPMRLISRNRGVPSRTLGRNRTIKHSTRTPAFRQPRLISCTRTRSRSSMARSWVKKKEGHA